MVVRVSLIAPFSSKAAWDAPFMVAQQIVEWAQVTSETGVIIERLDENYDLEAAFTQHSLLPETKEERVMDASQEGFATTMVDTFTPRAYDTDMPHFVLDGALCIDVPCQNGSDTPPTHWYRVTAFEK